MARKKIKILDGDIVSAFVSMSQDGPDEKEINLLRGSIGPFFHIYLIEQYCSVSTLYMSRNINFSLVAQG